MTWDLQKRIFSWPEALMKSKRCFSKAGFLAAILICAVLSFPKHGFAQNDGGIEKTEVAVIANTTYFSTATAFASEASAVVTYSQEPAEIPGTRKIKNIITLELHEEMPEYVSTDFSADINVEIKYGNSEATANTITRVLKVNYKKGNGEKYDAKNYYSFDNAQYVKITVKAPLPSMIGSFDPVKMLILKNEMRVTRYYQLTANAQVQNLSAVQPPAGADEMAVSWDMPQNIGHTNTQLEWTWIEDDFLPEYIDGNGNPNYNLVFNNNATRIDLPLDAVSYKIPLLYGGPGRLYYRIRAVNIQSNSRSDGSWSAPQYKTFGGHNQALNWQSSASYAEEGKRKVVVEYFDGSLRSRQTVTKENVNNTIVTAETFYDGQGRPAIQILPAPGISNIIAYTKNLNRFNSQLDDEDPANYFDLQTIGSTSTATPPLDASAPNFGAAKYYSTANTEMNNGVNKYIPDAEGYPYTVTRYTPDATGRIMTQSGVGAAMKMGSGHETKYYYGTAAQEELDGLFGTEVGNFTHYFKNMVKDANGQMSVSYVDMHGRTIATALAGDAPTGMTGVFNPAHYPNQQGTELTRDLLNGNTNVVKGNSVESVNTILIAVPTSFHFEYKLTPEALPLTANNAPVCYDCMYDLEIIVRDEAGEQVPVVKKYNNISVSADDDCNTAVQQFKDEAGNPISGNLIEFNTPTLPEGSYIVRKTLTISEASLEKYKQEYIAKALVETEEQLITTIYNEMLQTATCDDPPPTDPCAACDAAIGSFETYRDNYLATAPGTPLTEIQKNYDEQKLNCERLCNKTSQVVNTKRQLMIADMLAYSGQYSRELEEGTTPGAMYTQYNIAPATNPAGSDPELAESLLPQHPEYARLLYAESAPMKNVFNWITTFLNTTTYQEAFDKGYIADPALTDPFYTLAPTYKPAMDAKLSNFIQNMSMWKLAYGNALCRTIVDPIQREACYSDPSHNAPPFSGLTTEELDKVWNAFKSLYAFERNNQVNDHIAVTNPLPNAQALVEQGYILHFPNSNQQLAEQLSNHSESGADWNWYPAAGETEPDLSDFPGGITATDVYTGRCNGYIEQWKQVLLECPALAEKLNRDAIITEITDAMKLICIQSSNEANPYGASNLPPGATGQYQSFEAAINAIFSANGIQRSNVCNPFVIEAPKPYSSGSSWTKEYATVLEKCNCDRFSELKAEAQAAGKNTSVLSSFNEYLMSKYGEELTQPLYDAMVQNCALLGTTVCETVNAQGQCIDRHCANVGNHFTLADPQPMPAFLKCGFTDRIRCLNCAELSDYINQLKNNFASIPGTTYEPQPRFTGTDLSDKNIQDNILFAQFVNYRTGFHYLWTDYAKKAKEAQAECNLDNYQTNGSATQNVICRDTKPLNDPTDFIVEEAPCADVMNMAIVKAQHIMKLRRQSLIEDFEKLYRAKCMLATGEEFTVTYTPREYHYTLYYYDMAGNLVKTVPPAGARPDFTPGFLVQVKTARASGTDKMLPHELATQYRYNSLNQVVAQNSPDAGTSKFWYDRLGRLAVSQNAQQEGDPQQESDDKYSYTRYDLLGRITEVGQKPQSTPMTQDISQNKVSVNALEDWILNEGGTREQITFTVYDIPYMYVPNYDAALYPLLVQQNLRNRVSYTGTIKFATDAHPQQHTATFYTYDIHGNVDILLQDYKGITEMNGTENRFKRITYDYDLISGKVNAVNYQPPFYNSATNSWTNNKDAFYHQYHYDAENRLTKVETSRDKIVWETDATYQYYKHGPLARTEYGQQRVQGIDYAYTLQGWLKGVNSTALSAASAGSCPEGTVLGSELIVTGREQLGKPSIYTASQAIIFDPNFVSDDIDAFETLIDPNATVCTPGQGNQSNPYTPGDMGRDGDPTGDINSTAARDAFGFALNYYNNDYTAIGTGVQSFATGLHSLPQWTNNGVADGMVTGEPLFNGNIASMLVNIPKLGIAGDGVSGANPILYGYRYDQLNRIVGMNAYKNDPANTQANTFSPQVMADYKERISYDPNGNILSYHRNGTSAPPAQGGGTAGTAMDDLTYRYLYAKTDNSKGEYIPGVVVNDPLFSHYTNQLASVQDAIGDANYTIDIDNQDALNYVYDNIGNLVKDKKEGILNISWTVYGKISSITKDADKDENGVTTNDRTTITYTYDAAGNRISKTVAPPQGADKTIIYVRDASGNTMSVYESETAGATKQTDIHLYGSSRIGMVTEQDQEKITKPDAELAGAYFSTFTRSEKIFELSNHLGNVLVTISDKRKAVDSDVDGDIDYYEAEVVSANDYYPGGMDMPGRQYNSMTGYRYGFNGKEKDNKDGVVQYDYGFRIYDPRLVKFKSVDPLQVKYPELTPYQFASNSPIQGVDLDGREIYHYLKTIKDGKPVLEYQGVQTRHVALWEIFDYRTDNWKSFNGDKITGKLIYVHEGSVTSDAPEYSFSYFKELHDWQAAGFPTKQQIDNSGAEMSRDAVTTLTYMDLSQKIDQADGDNDGYVNPNNYNRSKSSPSGGTGNQATSAHSSNPGAAKSNTAKANTVQKVNGRNPINSSYAGKTYTFAPGTELAKKYSAGVKFNDQGFPDFSPYAKKTIDIGKLNPSSSTDILKANKAAGYGDVVPANFTWHHVENSTKLQLVPTDLHKEVKHTGGRATNAPSN